MLLGAATAGPFRFIQGLGRLGLPTKLVGILELALRYLDLLLDEARRMRRAQRCRGQSTNLPLGERMRYSGQMLGTLFLRTLDRAERVQLAMTCRGLGGVTLQSELPAMSSGNVAVTILMVLSTAWYLTGA
jgi:cobalt/nickel transport system permease protein